MLLALPVGLSYAQLTDEVNITERSVLQPGESIEERVRKNFFLRTEVTKTTCYVGEPLMVVYKVYSRLNSSSQVVKRPSLTGFSILEMVDNYDQEATIEKLNGESYYVSVIRKVHLFPLQEGNFTLDPAAIESLIYFVQIHNNAARTRIEYPVSLQSPPVAITVKPLPEAKQPEYFTGAVGQYTLQVEAPKEPIHTGELVKIRIIISGSGNISLLTPPIVQWPQGVDTADPSVKETVNRYVYPLSGSKAFEYSFAAPDTGVVTLPAIRFPYFDPVNQSYKIADSDPVIMRVLSGMPEDTARRRDAALAEVNKTSGGLPRHLYWFAGVVIAIVAWITWQAIQLRRSKKHKQSVPAQPVAPAPEPLPSADDMLKVARAALHQGDQKLFLHELQQSLWKLAALRCAVAPSSLNKQNIAERLASLGAPPQVAHEFKAVLQECEWALYVPAGEMGDGGLLLEKTEKVLNDLLQV